MTELPLPLLSLAVVALVVGAATTRRASPVVARRVALAAVGVALVASAAAARLVLTAGARLGDGWGLPLSADAFTVIPMVLFSTLLLLTLVMAPLRDRGPSALSLFLTLGAATLATYAANHAAVLWVGAAVSAAPLWWARNSHDEDRFSGDDTRARIKIAVSLLLLAAGLVAMGLGADDNGTNAFALPALARDVTGHENFTAFWLLAASAVIRGGIFPFHGWVLRAIERGPLLNALLVVNAQVGIFVAVRVAAPLAPSVAQEVFPSFGVLALATAMYVSFGALGERAPRRVIARLLVSQSAVMQAALTSATTEGVTGALLHWTVIAVATSGMLLVCRAVEVRVGHLAEGDQLLGLGAAFPRFAVFFAGFGLAVAGLPGTLGFCSEDLLLHGALETNRFIAIALPTATALNAFQMFRLFTRIFLGKPSEVAQTVPDALPHERWVLTLLLVFLIASGLTPSALVDVHLPAAEALVAVHGAPH